MTQLFENVNEGAEFSGDRKYRYALWRIWDESKPLVMFVGLNPSTANETDNDPTIRCVIKFAKQWGYGGVYMANLFGLVSSNPADLLTCKDPVGDNDHQLEIFSRKCKDVVFAWGKFNQAQGRRAVVEIMFPGAFCIGKKDGHPFHPLWAGVYAKKEQKANFTNPVKFKNK